MGSSISDDERLDINYIHTFDHKSLKKKSDIFINI